MLKIAFLLLEFSSLKCIRGSLQHELLAPASLVARERLKMGVKRRLNILERSSFSDCLGGDSPVSALPGLTPAP